jgi:hypothetical protein
LETAFVEIKERAMATPIPNSDYRAVQFSGYADAAAFFAALSRYLNAPDSSTAPGSVELWGQVSEESGITFYLNDAALNATTEAFGQPLSGETYPGSTLPFDSILLIGGQIDALDDEQAEAYLRAQLL